MHMVNEAGPLILGGFLAVLGGVLQHEYVQWRSRQRQKKLLRVFLVHEIRQINRILDKLIETYDKSKTVYLLYLVELAAARPGYDRNSDWIILFEEEVRQKIFDYFNTEQITRTALQALVGLLSQPGIDINAANGEIAKQINALRNMKGNGEDVIHRINP